MTTSLNDESLRVILDGLRHGPVHITADRCSGDSRAVNAFCDLIKAAPALAAEVLRLRAERDALRAIIAGRTTPPSAEESAAHYAMGGTWLILRKRDATTVSRERLFWSEALGPSVHTLGIDDPNDSKPLRWIALTCEGGLPCPWPEVAR